MKAIVTTAAGGPEVLKLEDIPDPVLHRDTDILVRVKAAGVNPVDTKMRAIPNAYPAPLPPVLGCDGAGVVEAVGRAVTAFKPGDEVFYCRPPHHDRGGSYAQRMLVDHRHVAKKPKRMSFVEAAAMPLVLITAWESLHDRVEIKSWHRVLVHAGAGGVGHVAIQLARIAGAEVCTTVGSAEKAEFARSFGANHIINYKEQEKEPISRSTRWAAKPWPTASPPCASTATSSRCSCPEPRWTGTSRACATSGYRSKSCWRRRSTA